MSRSGSGSTARTAITVVMDVLVIVAVVALTHLVVSFFGQLSSASWGKGVLTLSRLVVLPLGIEDVKTPYGGVFVFDAATTVVLLLAAEWALGLVRRSA